VIDYKRRISAFARCNGLEIIYAFGSRAKEILARIQGKTPHSAHPRSDLDLGIKPVRPLSVKEKVRIAIFFEDLFDISRVDVVSLPEAPASLGGEIVSGELLYAANEKNEADCQLYHMRRAADLLPFERERARMIMGASK
jgi:predicted nucleotidyltransferase